MRIQPGLLAGDGHAAPGQVWRPQTALLGIVSVAILLLFGSDVRALATVWWTSTTFGHCLFIAPVVV
ncbi:hypothetical protein K3W91_14785, partial [Listeria monocytogenes]|nr:hypothetical protein [Listeria monocytogenes]